MLVALAPFFRFSAVGVAVRATAENADRASLLGIPVRRLQSVVWGLAALLAFIAIFLRIGFAQTIGEVLDPTILLSALGAAVIGRMERMPTVVLAAVGPRHRRPRRDLPLPVEHLQRRDPRRRSSRSRCCCSGPTPCRGSRARRRRRGARPARSSAFPPSCATGAAVRWAYVALGALAVVGIA